MLLYARQFSDNPPALLAYVGAVILVFATALTFHEFMHAWTANQLGDDTAKRAGRLTLNPIKHIDPLGGAMILLLGFGFAKPTPVNPYRLRTGAKNGHALVAVAGPLSNFVFAALAALPFRLGLVTTITSFDHIATASGQEIVGLLLAFFIFINVMLGVFNLVPIPPLDGFAVFLGILPNAVGRELSKLHGWGPGILMSMFAIGFVAPQYSPISWIVGPVANQILRVIV
jgi:Zn-dependent protease